MSGPDRCIVRNVNELQSARSVCGFRHTILTKDDGGPCSLSQLNINDSRRHYHKVTTEVYYVLKGEGEMVLGNDTVKLEPGVAIMIPPGLPHTAKGEVEVLIYCTPPYESEDVHFDCEE